MDANGHSDHEHEHEEELDHEQEHENDIDYDLDTASLISEDQNGYSSNGTLNNTLDHLPLIPTDFTSITEALQNFTVVFESRYGGLHPRFQTTSLREAMDEAFGITSRQAVLEQKPLAIYLHHDHSIAGNIFAQQVLCSDAISSLLNCQFVTWPWDVTQADNRGQLCEWLTDSNLGTVKDIVKTLIKPDEYPLLIVVMKDRSKFEVELPIRGADDVDAAMEKLLISLDKFQEIKNRDMAEEQHRMERAQIRQEQVDEYQKSLAIDRARQEEQMRQKQEEIKNQEEEQKRFEEQQQKQAEIASLLPPEPAEDDPNALTIRLRFPSGEQKMRRFLMSEPVSWLLQYLESLGFEASKYRVITSDRPPKDVTTLDTTQSFAQLGWSRREALTVDEK
ncbi:AT hook and UBX domain containing protein [Aphelenchoides fujianensis]|nr:AT hook and UBX domain containing protein [Aphelenchoides fujianensis]